MSYGVQFCSGVHKVNPSIRESMSIKGQDQNKSYVHNYIILAY